MPTIKDVAALAGVSRGTVDRVIHGRPNVDPLVVQKVKLAMNALGYGVKAPAGQPLKTAAILIPQWTDTHFNRQVITGIRRAIRHLDDPAFSLIERPLRTLTTQEVLIEMEKQVRSGVDGLIIRAENTEDVSSAIDYAVSHGVAVMTYDTDVVGSKRLCHVGQDLIRAGEIAAGVMAKLVQPAGQVLIVTGNMRLEAHKGRVDGFCKRWRELGFDQDSYEIIETNEMHDLTRTLTAEILRGNRKLQGVYAATQPVSGCIEGIRKARPDDAMPHIICNDLTPAAKKYLHDEKVDFVIGQAFYQKSYRAVIAMHRLLIKGQHPQKEIIYTDTSLITKEML